MAKTKLKRVEEPKADVVRMGDITSPEFQQALSMLMGQPLSISASVALLKAHDAVSVQQKLYEDVRQRLVIKHGDLDAEGKVKLNEEKTKYLLKDPAGFDREFKELLNLAIELPKIPLSYVADCKLSAALLSSLLKTVLNPEA